MEVSTVVTTTRLLEGTDELELGGERDVDEDDDLIGLQRDLTIASEEVTYKKAVRGGRWRGRRTRMKMKRRRRRTRRRRRSLLRRSTVESDEALTARLGLHQDLGTYTSISIIEIYRCDDTIVSLFGGRRKKEEEEEERGGTEGDEDGVHVGDGRGGANVATETSRVADLITCKPPREGEGKEKMEK